MAEGKNRGKDIEIVSGETPTEDEFSRSTAGVEINGIRMRRRRRRRERAQGLTIHFSGGPGANEATAGPLILQTGSVAIARLKTSVSRAFARPYFLRLRTSTSHELTISL